MSSVSFLALFEILCFLPKEHKSTFAQINQDALELVLCCFTCLVSPALHTCLRQRKCVCSQEHLLLALLHSWGVNKGQPLEEEWFWVLLQEEESPGLAQRVHIWTSDILSREKLHWIKHRSRWYVGKYNFLLKEHKFLVENEEDRLN